MPFSKINEKQCGEDWSSLSDSENGKTNPKTHVDFMSTSQFLKNDLGKNGARFK